MEVREEMVRELKNAMVSLQRVYQMAVTAAPIAAEVPVIKEVKGTAQKCNDMMLAISKMRI